MFVFLSICTVKCKSCDRFAATVLFLSLLFVSLKYIFTRYTKMHIFRSHELYLFCILKLVNIIVAAHIRVVFSFESFLKLCTKIKDFVVEILFTPLNRKLCVRVVCVCVCRLANYLLFSTKLESTRRQVHKIFIYTVNKNPNNTISTFVWLNGCFCSSWFRFFFPFSVKLSFSVCLFLFCHHFSSNFA